MRAVVQRVGRARVTLVDDGIITGEIGRGFLVLIGIRHDDTLEQVEFLASKVAGLRVFEDAAGKMNLGLNDIGGALLVVSQFTLYGDCRKGRRPSFTEAARPEPAEKLYQAFVDSLKKQGYRVQTGKFQAEMAIELVNDGPVTLILDTDELAKRSGH